MDKRNIEIFEKLQVSDRSLFEPNFRNCMMHYSFRNINGDSLIKDIEYDINRPFFGLIESCYDNDMKYDDLKTRIDVKLNDISSILEEWLDIQIDDLKIVNPVINYV